MSWNCPICGKGHEKDHSECNRVQYQESSKAQEAEEMYAKLDKIIELLEKIASEGLCVQGCKQKGKVYL